MAREYIRLNGVKYKVGVINGRRLWSMSARASQRGDPGGMAVAEWDLNQSACESVEDVSGGVGCLGIDYTDGADARWHNILTLGPLINVLTLSTYDQVSTGNVMGGGDAGVGVLGTSFILGASTSTGASTDNASGVATMYQAAAARTFAYIIHGQGVAKVRLSDMTLHDSGVGTLPATATDIIATEAADPAVRQEVSIAMGDVQPYIVLQQGGQGNPPTTDVWNANASGIAVRMFGNSGDRVVSAALMVIRGNILTGSVTMRNPNWSTVATLSGERKRINSFEMDSNLWIIGTSDGPYLLDDDLAEFLPVMRSIDNHNDNCLRLAYSDYLGVLVPLVDGTRYISGGSGESWGIERFLGNTSVVQGRATAHAESSKWLYQALYNDVTGDTWLIAWRPRQPGDRHGNPMTPYTIARFTGLRSNFLSYIGTVNGERTSPALIGGYGQNMFWVTIGRHAREISDTNYRYAASGTAYLTELQRRPDVIKDLEAIEFESANCTANRTITVGIAADGGSVNLVQGTLDYGSGATLNGIVNTNGFQRILLVDNASVPLTWATGRRFKPEVRFATTASTDAPQIAGGVFRVFYRSRPLMVNVYRFSLVLEENGVRVAETDNDALLDLMRSGPVLVAEDLDNDSYYVRVDSVEIKETIDLGGGKDSSRGSMRLADITMTTWATTG